MVNLDHGRDTSRRKEVFLPDRKSILFLTTDRSFGDTIERLLVQNGYTVSIAGSISSGLSVMGQTVPTIALVDRRLDVIGQLRSQTTFRKIPSIAILPLGHQCSEEEYIRDLDQGFDVVFCSDRYRELIAHIRAMFRRHQSERSSSSMLKAGVLQMDLDRYEVRVGGVLKPVTHKEFEILRHLLQSSGHVLSRQELLNRVWGEDYALEEHALDVHIHSLRRKIEPTGSSKRFIVTVRGVGYKLQEE
jgi:two-component system, OmpR family, response regulator RegX3